MTALPRRVLYYGADVPPASPRILRAGPLTVAYEHSDIRYIRLGQHEILRRVYAAVRDHNWGTVPDQLSDVHVTDNGDSFEVTFHVDNQQNDIDFGWDGTITGTADGVITFKFEGEARSTFKRNRVGFCVLHPMDVAGQACTIQHVDGSTTEDSFPQYIAPHQPFFGIRKITHEVMPGVQAEVLMEGDTFETEDQRNWTDASFKTYCTPLEQPFPVTVEAGTRITQTITVRLVGEVPQVESGADSARVTFAIGSQAVPLMRLGLDSASHGRPLTVQEVQRLKLLNLAHLRIDIHTSLSGYRARLTQAAGEARALGVSLQVALHLGDNPEVELADLRAMLVGLDVPVAAWLVFKAGEKSTSAEWLVLARAALGDYKPDALIGGGTDAFFTELNRERPPVEALDLVVYSFNPQVHAFQNIDMVETLAAQAATIKSARQFSGGKPIAVSPVTLSMRWNPNATGAAPEIPPDQLPPRVDVRQMSLFGAGWTLGSIKYQAESGLHSTTFYETTGWLGVMEVAGGCPLPAQFQSLPGAVFPMYHIFAWVGAFAGGEVVHSQSSAPLSVDGLVLRKDGNTRVMLANFTGVSQEVHLPGLSGTGTLRTLDETNALEAMQQPEAFQQQAGETLSAADGFVLELLPYAVVMLDVE